MSDYASDGVAVIIPALDEAEMIAGTIAHLRLFPDVREIVVVDGGSRDATVDLARGAGAKVLEAGRGRGRQMNAGVHATTSGTLVFLHADCRLPPRAFDAMRQVLQRGRRAGVFGIRYDSTHPLLRLIGTLSRLQTPLTQFGEGALFVHRELFESVGGFPEWLLMEDVGMLSKLRRTDGVGRARGSVLASARRYAKCGIWRQLLRNGALLLMFHLGVSTERLSRLYPDVR